MHAPVAVARLIRAYVAREIDDATMTRWLRGVCADGLSPDDTFALTMAMARSGDIVDWTGLPGPIVDKHSTGGVGDAVSLIAVPLAAACGARVAKLSGRALGHTGGTIDKLECIPGLRTELSVDEFRRCVGRVGCAIAAAADSLAPADKRLYRLRHQTGTVASVPLIAASVMSKKIAAGASSVVIDVKSGPGAIVASPDDARALAAVMRDIGRRAGLRVATIVTRMDEPLASSAGDALETDEALRVMEGDGGSPALRDLACVVAAIMLSAAGLPGDAVRTALENGRALAKFAEMAAAQGGRLEKFDRSWSAGRDVVAGRDGVVASIDARRIGEAIASAKQTVSTEESRRIGARLHRRVGDKASAGERLMTWWLPAEVEVPPDIVRIADTAPLRAALIADISGPEGLT